jgi:CobQ/CobB/MinD/ParA nucleotide binding domain
MKSEIPQLQVITAISDSDCEDFVSQLLFSQGWSIIYRAIDMAGLMDFLAARKGELRTVVIFKSDLPGFDGALLESASNPKVKSICIDEIETNSHKLMTFIRGQLRLPLIANSISSKSTSTNSITTNPKMPELQATKNRKPCVITITGTVGAPGRSSIALNLANYLAESSQVNIFDADIRAPALEYFVGRAENRNENLKLINLISQERLLQTNIGETSCINIIDLGPLPPLTEVVNDRRWQAGFINRTLEETTTLIYLCKSTGLSLIRLEQFMSQFPVLLRNLPIIYILNQSGNTREDRALANRFAKICDGETSFVLPMNNRINTNLAEPTKRETGFGRTISEIGRIAQEIK